MSKTVFVAGVGVISGIGNNTAECLNALQNSRAGIDKIKYLQTIHQDTFPVAEVKLNNDELAQLSGFKPGISRTAMLSLIAAREAKNDAGIQNFASLRTGFISANTVGGMDKTEDFFVEFMANPAKGKLRNVVNHECGKVTELVADELGIKNYISTISTACSSSANAIMYGARLIKNNILDVVIAGGTDALTRFTLNGFNTLMILDNQYCQPFDANRRGLNLGEGAGYITLVSERVAAGLQKAPYCTLSGYCNANDAYHQTASSPDGTGSFMAMGGALKMSGLEPKDIGYINLHGTGTQNNDNSEGTAIKRLFDPHFPKMSSTKSFTGHTLGASAGIEAVFSALSAQQGFIYPNLRFETQIADHPFAPERSFTQHADLNHVLSNSFGFGGNCSSLIFSKLPA
ncbi:beta-ketoacyl-[acyl-carrier-protein] synthase family protein [Mucilaginibacter ginsenosidivorax]|uniref:Beta-ketoacyl-[acyl-carrier-protein] synthase family protein n=1 Tax=Mucilaginibacter ginsenosidivorax TaxID=862126 RepID=A0A5B8VZ26_9SPHI|nr:beta-ketoacyl-[acyl-carrier-protein] synthase family protein [Mucilaginibacter ginsenosidivorax]QEC76719.1 beta-ketoacyl-[acyl-carrier-protein] synthase family protein [Mucilaginibacter ginsenosidivorax]